MNRVNTWAELVGPVLTEESVPEDIRQEPGLIHCTTKRGTEVYPIKQFSVVENGRKVPSPAMQKAVLLLAVGNVSGTGYHDWTNAGFLLGTPQETLDGATFADILADVGASEADTSKALGALLSSVSFGLERNGIDPEKVWGFVFRNEEPSS
ncbi:MAG: hypothetical protein AAB914_02815 [Patescibacteria group bacterium]